MSGMKLLSKKMPLQERVNNKKHKYQLLHNQTREAYIHTVSTTKLFKTYIISLESGSMSVKTAASKASYKNRVAAEKKKDAENVEWDRSTVASDKK